ncbi:MAG: hypothetical protein ACRDIY_08090 [Chloroflexota bacterium]
MFAMSHAAIRCQNPRCARQGEPYAFLNLGTGDEARVVCPTCGWVSTVRVDRDGRPRSECRAGAAPTEPRDTARSPRPRRARAR